VIFIALIKKRVERAYPCPLHYLMSHASFGVAPSQVSIIRGLVSRMKRIHVAGIEEPKAREALVV